MADRTTAPKGALITGLVFLLLAFGGCGYGCTTFVGFAGDVVETLEDSRTVPVGQPTTFTASGDWAMVFTTSSATQCSVDGPGQINLQGPPAGTDSEIELEGRNLTFRYVFETQQGAEYRVVCGDELEGGGGEYVVAPFPGFGGLVAGLAGIGIGGLFFVIGTILVIVGLVRRSKWKKQQGGGYGAPPATGYGPPPSPGYQPPPSPGGYGPPPTPGGYGPPPSGPSAPPPASPPGGPPSPPPPPSGPPPMGPPPGSPPPPPAPGDR